MLEKIISDGPPRMIRAAGRIASAFGLASDGAPDRGSVGKEADPAGLAVADEPIEPPDDTTAASIERSVRESDATLWLGPTTAPSARAVVLACVRLGKPCLPIDPCAEFQPAHIADWLTKNHVKTLNVAGNRGNEQTEEDDHVEQLLDDVLIRLGHERTR